MKVFKSLEMAYYINADQNAGIQFDSFWPTNMTEMMIETRPRYPSNKLTFTIANNLVKGTTFQFFNIYLSSYGESNIDIFMEDSKRKFMNSF